MANPVSGGWNRSILVNIWAKLDEMALTWICSIEETSDLCYVLESFVVDVAFLS
jgi:hypothetical protein